jgi:hypothetical protein
LVGDDDISSPLPCPLPHYLSSRCLLTTYARVSSFLFNPDFFDECYAEFLLWTFSDFIARLVTKNSRYQQKKRTEKPFKRKKEKSYERKEQLEQEDIVMSKV